MQDDQTRPGGLSAAILILALLAGATFYLGAQTMAPSPALIAWKGAGVALLALWAALQARNLDGWLIACVMAFGAAGDVLLDAVSLEVGAVAFLIGHLVAILLYLRNRRPEPTGSQVALAIILVPAAIFIAWTLPADRAAAPGIALYTAGLALMAATAWISRFPRYWTGFGALLFVVSDLLIFARLGPLAGSAIPGLLIWPCYFTGQALIVMGVVRTLDSART